MTSEQVILEKILHLSETVRQQWEGIQKQGDDIGEIKKTVSLIAVQSNRIDNLASQVGELWIIRKEHEDKIRAVETFQASCPRENLSKYQQDVKDTIRQQWVAIGILAAALVAVAGWIKMGG